jgi:hypothetical protein
MSKRNNRYEDLGKLWRSTRPQHSRPRCHTNGCMSRSSRNHLLQKNGIISQIAENKHVWELRTNRFRIDNYYSLEKIGLGQAMSMYGYCPDCDNQIFSLIEKPIARLPETLTDVCRYSLRPIVHEIRKKEGNLKFLKSRDSDERANIVESSSPIFSPVDETHYGIYSLKSLASVFSDGLSESVPISYVLRELPRVEICASSILIHPMWHKYQLNSNKSDFLSQISTISRQSFNVINLFPFEDKSILISVTHSESNELSQAFQKIMQQAKITKLTRVVSNMLIAQIEDWAISDKLYSKLPKNFTEMITYAKLNQSQNFYKDFNFNLWQYSSKN